MLLLNMHRYTSLPLTQGQQIINFLNELASNAEDTNWSNLVMQRLARLLAVSQFHFYGCQPIF